MIGKDFPLTPDDSRGSVIGLVYFTILSVQEAAFALRFKTVDYSFYLYADEENLFYRGHSLASDSLLTARENAGLAHESYVRCLNFTRAWLEHRGPESGLIPSNLTSKADLWEPHNSAADNYEFMVLTAYLLDKELYDGPIGYFKS